MTESKLNCILLKYLLFAFSHGFIFGNMFPESHAFDAVPVTRSNNFPFSN